VATQPIAKHEAATISYVAENVSRADRLARLSDVWHFECRCPRCTDPTDPVDVALTQTVSPSDQPPDPVGAMEAALLGMAEGGDLDETEVEGMVERELS